MSLKQIAHHLTLSLQVEAKFKPSMPSSAWSQCGKFALFTSYADPALAATNSEAPAEDSDAGDEDCSGLTLAITWPFGQDACPAI
eukprot:2711334-Amphidinium_carterae.1